MIRYDGLQRGNLFIISILEKISKGRILAPTNHSQDVLVGVLVLKNKKKQSYDNIPSQITASFHIKSYLHKFNMWHLTSGFRGGRKYSKEAASRANSGQNIWIKAAFCTVQHQIHLSFTKVLFDRAIKVDFFLLSNYPYQWPLFHLIFKYWSYCSHSCSITKTQPYTVISMYGYTSTILIPLPINDLDRRVMIMGC